jgi:hypothetical protein
MLGDQERLHEFFDTQGNHYFRDKNGNLIANSAITPFRRPASLNNIEFYYHRAKFLWERGYRIESVKILKEILSLKIDSHQKGFGLGKKYKDLTIKYVNLLRGKYGWKFTDIYDSNSVIFSEYLAKKAQDDLVRVIDDQAYFTASFPSSWTIKLVKYSNRKNSLVHTFVLDSREDFIIKSYQWEENLQKALKTYNFQEFYDYITYGKHKEKVLEPFKFQITNILDLWEHFRPKNREELRRIWFRRRGVKCKGTSCNKGGQIVFSYKQINSPLENSNQYEYERTFIYRKNKFPVLIREVYILKKKYSYVFILETAKKHHAEAVNKFDIYLKTVKITPPGG